MNENFIEGFEKNANIFTKVKKYVTAPVRRARVKKQLKSSGFKHRAKWLSSAPAEKRVSNMNSRIADKRVDSALRLHKDGKIFNPAKSLEGKLKSAFKDPKTKKVQGIFNK